MQMSNGLFVKRRMGRLMKSLAMLNSFLCFSVVPSVPPWNSMTKGSRNERHRKVFKCLVKSFARPSLSPNLSRPADEGSSFACSLSSTLIACLSIAPNTELELRCLILNSGAPPLNLNLSLYNLNLSLYNLNLSLYNLNLSLYNLNLSLYNLNLSLYNLILCLYNLNLSLYNINLGLYNRNLGLYKLILCLYNLNLGLYNRDVTPNS